jgi:ABC-type thiamin/hydroxymethylpyrimidine transport system permease subunit
MLDAYARALTGTASYINADATSPTTTTTTASTNTIVASDSKPVILVTGGNQGLGHETLRILARTNKYHLVVAARS